MIRFGGLIQFFEALMPWLLVSVPLVAVLRPAGRSVRIRRGVEAVGCVLVLGLCVLVAKVFLSAEVAHQHSERRERRIEAGKMPR